jgi:hypothetical protein
MPIPPPKKVMAQKRPSADVSRVPPNGIYHYRMSQSKLNQRRIPPALRNQSRQHQRLLNRKNVVQENLFFPMQQLKETAIQVSNSFSSGALNKDLSKKVFTLENESDD